MDSRIPSTFWLNEALSTPALRLAALWLKTNQTLNLLGCGELNVRIFAFETGLNPEALHEACEALGEGLVRRGREYWLRDFIGQHFGRGLSLSRTNMRKPLLRAIAAARSPWVGLSIYAEYPELKPGYLESHLAESPKGLPSPSAEGPRGNNTTLHNTTLHNTRIGGAGGKVADGPKPAAVDEVIAYAATIGLPEAEARKFFDHYEANGWRQGGRAALKSWQAALRLWKRRWNEGGPGGAGQKSSGGPPPGYDPSQPNAATGGIALEN